MDRHDLLGATAEDVARAHVLDLGPSARLGVQFLSYWFDADNGATFCLAKAATPVEMRPSIANYMAWSPTRSSASPRRTSAVPSQDPRSLDHTQVMSAFRRILFTDLKGSTSLLHEVGEPAYVVCSLSTT